MHWQSVDERGNTWFTAAFDLREFDLIGGHPEAVLLQQILRLVREEDNSFLRHGDEIHATTRLEFPREWGLGSSSTLIDNIAQWAQVCPFKLQLQSMGGSGYDIACARANGPILYQRESCWEVVDFSPDFSRQLYFVYLGRKQSTAQAIHYYRQANIKRGREEVSTISRELIQASTLQHFELLLNRHEEIVSTALDLPPVRELYFPGYWGTIKSLGARGGDFVLATSEKSAEETLHYFEQKGFSTILNYDDMIGGAK